MELLDIAVYGTAALVAIAGFTHMVASAFDQISDFINRLDSRER